MMEFLQPAGAWAFLGAGIILALYFLRRRHVDTPVSSTLLWKKAAADQSAARPFQRLRRNPLLLLQLLIACLLAFSLMRPALPGAGQGETVMIFDLSASMQAETEGKTRLQAAVEKALAQIDALNPDAPLTLLTAGRETGQPLSRSTDRQAAREALRALRPENAGADLSAALSLAKAMDEQLGGVRIVVFSDDFSAPAGIDAINAPKGVENRALLSLSAAGGAAVLRVANYGENCEITVECYADGALCDARRLQIAAGETASARLTVPENAAVLRGVIVESDGIAPDNQAYCIARETGERVVALAGENTFLEHALTLRGDVRLIRTTPAEIAALDADVYVRDDGIVTFSRTSEAPPVTAGEKIPADGALRLVSDPALEPLTDHLSFSGVALRAYAPLSGGLPFLLCGEDVLGAAGADFVALGFDLHDSNLPLKYDFPLLIQNILAYLAPADAGAQDGICGESLQFSVTGGTVETPGGQRVPLPESGRFTQTGEAGLYILRTEEKALPFALSMDLSESDARQVAPSQTADADGAFTGSRDLTPWLLLLCFLLILLEGGVSRRVG